MVPPGSSSMAVSECSNTALGKLPSPNLHRESKLCSSFPPARHSQPARQRSTLVLPFKERVQALSGVCTRCSLPKCPAMIRGRQRRQVPFPHRADPVSDKFSGQTGPKFGWPLEIGGVHSGRRDDPHIYTCPLKLPLNVAFVTFVAAFERSLPARLRSLSSC
jgi:hypothetical protein